jgi:hypothetical protein
VDVVYGCECDVVYGYVMKYIEYGCACGFKFPTVQLVIPISIKIIFRPIYNGWGCALVDKPVLSMSASWSIID